MEQQQMDIPYIFWSVVPFKTFFKALHMITLNDQDRDSEVAPYL